MNEQQCVIAFVDLSRFAAQSERVSDTEIAQVLDEFYEDVGAAVAARGGRVVKFIGDAALIVFPIDAADRAVEELIALKRTVDDRMSSRGWECRLTVRVHCGTVISGEFGARGDKRFDVLGKAVNVAARLHGSEIALSDDVLRKVGDRTRRLAGL